MINAVASMTLLLSAPGGEHLAAALAALVTLRDPEGFAMAQHVEPDAPGLAAYAPLDARPWALRRVTCQGSCGPSSRAGRGHIFWAQNG